MCESLIHSVTTHNWYCTLPLGHIWRLWAQWEDNSTHPSLPYSAITLQNDCLGQFSKLHTLRKRNMRVKVSDTVLPPIIGLCITFGTYNGGFGHNGKIIQRTLPSHTQPSRSKLTVWASFRNFTHFGRETCAGESLIHSVTTHNWYIHYLWDIYGGFGHNGKIIQRTLPSHTQPSRSKIEN